MTTETLNWSKHTSPEPRNKNKELILQVIKWVLFVTVVPLQLLAMGGMYYAVINGLYHADSSEVFSSFYDFRRNRDNNKLEEAYKDASLVLKSAKDSAMRAEAKAYIDSYPVLIMKIQRAKAQKIAEETNLRLAYKKEKEQLLKKFKVRKDEYTGETYYYHPSVSHFNEIGNNNFYFYFTTTTQQDTPARLNLCINYFGNMPLDMEKIDLLVDKDRTLIDFYRVKNKKLNGGVAEWGENDFIAQDKEMLERLATAKNVKMKLRGDVIDAERVLTTKQIAGLSETYRLYVAMGGKLSSRKVRTPSHYTDQPTIVTSSNIFIRPNKRVEYMDVRVRKRPWWLGGGYRVRTKIRD